MLKRLDRLQITVNDRRSMAERWWRLFQAPVIREDTLPPPLHAERSVLRVGTSEIELLEPAGLGMVADHVSRRRGGLFSAGFAAEDLDAVGARLDALGIHSVRLDGQIYTNSDWVGIPGLRLVVSRDEEREPSGLLTRFYEASHLSHDYTSSAARFARVFQLDPSHFVPIRSEEYGYEGTLTLLDPNRLDRIETMTPFDHSKPMGRYFRQRGSRLYMAYAECDQMGALRERLLEHAPGLWTGRAEGPPPDNLYIHPLALEGVFIGVSRTSYAWIWSGHPERVEVRAAA